MVPGDVISPSMTMSPVPDVFPFSSIVPPPAVNAAFTSTSPVIVTPPPVPDVVSIDWLTVILPDVALMVTGPPAATPVPVAMPSVPPTEPTMISSDSVKETEPAFKSAAIVLMALDWVSEKVPAPRRSRLAASSTPPVWSAPSCDVNVTRSTAVTLPAKSISPVVVPARTEMSLSALLVVRLPEAVTSTFPEPSLPARIVIVSSAATAALMIISSSESIVTMVGSIAPLTVMLPSASNTTGPPAVILSLSRIVPPLVTLTALVMFVAALNVTLVVASVIVKLDALMP